MGEGRTAAIEPPRDGGTTAVIERWLEVLRDADAALGQHAREELIHHSKRRLEALCRKMFFHSLDAGPIDADDIYQESALRLWKALGEIRPTTGRQFFGLAATQIRRVLIDSARKYARSPVPCPSDDDATFDPAALEVWTRFHEEVETFPPRLREVVELLWYHDLGQRDAAKLLGVDKSTVKRRWREARTLLVERLRGLI